MKLTNEATASPRRIWLLGLLLATAAALRIYGAMNDYWLDEIWSLHLASTITSTGQVFTKIYREDNDYLNTLWFYWCGFHGNNNWPGYRIPSLAGGIGSVVLAWMIGRRRNARAACFAMLLVAFSYVQILYSSEARGYSKAVFFSLLSFYALEKYLEKQGWRQALLFSVSSILGFASHLIFLNFFGAAVLWSGWRLSKAGLGPVRAIKAMLACHAAPAAFLGVLYFIDLRFMISGNGTETGPGLYLDSFAWALGALPGTFGIVLTSLLAMAIFIAGLRMLRREKSDAWIFFAGVIVVMPVLLMILRGSAVIYVRYFLIGMVFFLILLSYILAGLYERHRTLCVLLLAGYFAVNGWHTISFFKYGRGHYGEAARFMADNTKGPLVTIGSDHDYRNGFVLQFYAGEALGNKKASYFQISKINSWPKGGPEWFITHKESFEEPTPLGEQITDAAGNSYEFVKAFPTAPLSGLHWFIYHNLGVSRPN